MKSASRFRLRLAIAFLGSFATIMSWSELRAEDNWPQFRGPTGRGHSMAKDVPLKWNADSVLWKTPLKGRGQSSPINWGDKLFLTGASDDGSARYLICVDAIKGKVLWEKEVACKSPENPHKMNSFATPTCATDGEHVVAFFGPGGLHCYDLEGKEIWSRDVGSFPGPWGVAASPIIIGNLVVQNCDAEGESSLLAVDINTGKPVWQTARQAKPRGGWSTPILIDADGKRELVLNGEFGVRGYDPKSGKELWFCQGFNGRGAPIPDYGNGLLYVVNGKPGDTYAVKPGGKGDVTKSHMKWHAKRRGGRDLPSPVVVGDYVIVVSMSGVASCYDAKSGETYWEERLGVEGEFAASPLAANGHVYLSNVYGGETLVIKPGKKLNVVSVNKLGADSKEIFRATLSPIKGKVYARSYSTLYCIGS